jgi:hypothetical protein
VHPTAIAVACADRGGRPGGTFGTGSAKLGAEAPVLMDIAIASPNPESSSRGLGKNNGYKYIHIYIYIYLSIYTYILNTDAYYNIS